MRGAGSIDPPTPPRRPDVGIKRAARIAQQIQEEIVSGRTPQGQVLGTEQQLCARYQVGCGTLREAVGILELRGIARMRRGPNGGLIAHTPDAQLVSQIFCGRAMLAGTTPAQLIEARQVLGRIAEQTRNGVVDLFTECLDTLDKHIAIDGQLAPLPATAMDRITVGARRAGQISRKVLAELMLGQIEPEARIGSEADLCRRYSISKSVARQTVRLLEDAGIVHCRRGRGRGLFASRPDAQGPLRAVSLYLQTRSVGASVSWQIAQLLKIECVGLAAARTAHMQAPPQELAREVLATVPPTRTSMSSGDMVLIDRSIEDLAANPLLSMMLESLKNHSTLTTDSSDTALARFAAHWGAEYLGHCREVAHAILAGDVRAAMRAQQAKNEFFAGRIRGELTSIC